MMHSKLAESAVNENGWGKKSIMHFRVKLAKRGLKEKVTESKWEEEEELWGGPSSSPLT